jgi:hypothetical protein
MKHLWFFKATARLATILAFGVLLPAQEPGCREISNLGAMARAKTPSALKARRQKAGDSYRAQLIFAARMFEIDSRNQSTADSLLNLLPKNEDSAEQSAWLDLTELEKCPSGDLPDSDLKLLDRLQYHLPRLIAKAAILVPEKMLEYIAYAFLSMNPDSDYAVQMQKVCRARHREFVDAVDKLSAENKSWFMSKIFDPDMCKTFAFPEQ